MSRPMSDREIRSRKRVQSGVSQATGALGLTALGGTLLATKRGSAATKGAFKAMGRERPEGLKPKNLRRKTAPILATSAGIGGLGSFNFASYTRGEAQKGKRNTVKKNLSAFGVEHGSGEVSKKKDKPSSGKMSTGRAVTGTLLAPYHGAVAGRGGKGKLKAAGSQVAGAYGGATLGAVAGGLTRSSTGVRLGAAAGGAGGAYKATDIANRRGWLKAEKKK